MPQLKKPELQQGATPHLIDTNVMLRYFIGDDSPKAARAAKKGSPRHDPPA